MTRQNWTEADTIAADDLYRRLGEKRLGATHPEVVALAERLGREPSAVAAQINNLHKAHRNTHWRASEMARKAAER
ncbi:hypothetical protein A7U43_13220 [Mycobacterium adipatum]|uniref:Uncharacterized protein n=1 Tax=Mycobacterium adipatum TaxID=1682113 RepID=A0A172ULM8_9MYCO|nr:hypothetical protein [Mycobacterium adipatum]ANE80149.1 hypothetical protein A7U43_13220 [Mycobacterium adipatum]